MTTPEPDPLAVDPDRLDRMARTARRVGWAFLALLVTGLALSVGGVGTPDGGVLLVVGSVLTSTGVLGTAVSWGYASTWRRTAAQERWFAERFGGSVAAARRALNLSAVAKARAASGEIGAVREIRRQLPEASLTTALRIARS